ncbi:MAG: DNA photolyase family protein [Acidiferrobacterales bacterium]|nr:DNA photolyase family protein [Acidiferrobacterales bacterium]
MKTILWCRQDLRLLDNPALHHAASKGEIVPVFVYPDDLGGASYWWLYHSLSAFSDSLKSYGVDLVLRTGNPVQVLSELATKLKVDEVVWNRVYSPKGIAEGGEVKKKLDKANVLNQSFNGQLLTEPTQIFNKQGTPFKVFTPFWRHCLSIIKPEAMKGIPKLSGVDTKIPSETLEEWSLLPTRPDWSAGLAQRWVAGEQSAQQRWINFLDTVISNYKEGRDFPAQDNTSYLSPHLAFGEISPRQIWFDVQERIAANQIDATNANKFLAEIGWREFSRYLLIHFPHIVDQPFNTKFQEFPWQNNPKLLKNWQKGQTGYPIVDAGMRELWHTGYMHNRVRMVCASFLTKHCLTHWREGMAWFWDTLVDADIGSNTASWQWVAGCGADAAPYFRIFNPIIQGEKFDKQGTYIKKWVPELAELPSKYINQPWTADPMTLQQANISLGETYPLPIVDHALARATALESYQAIK